MLAVSTKDDALHVRREPGEGPAVLVVEGELDPHTAPLLERELDEAIEVGDDSVVLDLESLGFMDSAGLRLLISAHNQLTASGRALILRRPSQAATRLLEITGLGERLPIEP